MIFPLNERTKHQSNRGISGDLGTGRQQALPSLRNGHSRSVSRATLLANLETTAPHVFT